MMKHGFRLLVLGASIVALAACATAQSTSPQWEPGLTPAEELTPAEAAKIPTVQPGAHDRLFELFKASDEAYLKRNPLQALFRGDLRYADRLGDNITDEY